MKKLFISLFATALATLPLVTALPALAAGASVSGGGTKTVGQNFTVTVTASGAEFDSLQGMISVSGPVSIVSFAAGGATWLPGKSPKNGGQFVGITTPTSRLTVASITLRGTKEGSGSVSVSGVKLARNGAYVGSSGGSTSFTITRALTPPGGVEVSSSTHPDQNVAYEATTAELSWKAPSNGANGYSVAFDQNPETVPATTISTQATTAKYENLAIGIYYFHVRANNADGWGPTTHFKITVKEPDPKIDDTLAKPTITSIEKLDSFRTDIAAGTVSGFSLKGTTQPGYVAILSFESKEKLPPALLEPITVSAQKTEGDTATEATPSTPKVVSGVKMTPLMAEPDAAGNWEIPFSAALPTGFYKVTVQGQKEKVLTPNSDPVYLEVSVANGGTAKFITQDDTPKPPTAVNVLGVQFRDKSDLWQTIALLLVSLALFGTWATLAVVRFRKRRLNS